MFQFGRGGELQSARLAELLSEIKDSKQHGFYSENYHLSMLSDVQQPAIVRELLATDAFLTQVRHRTIGVVSPHQIDPE